MWEMKRLPYNSNRQQTKNTITTALCVVVGKENIDARTLKKFPSGERLENETL